MDLYKPHIYNIEMRLFVWPLVVSAVASQYNPPAANPFCGSVSRRNAFSLDLTCEEGVIDSIPFAAYGTPAGSCGSFERDPSCDASAFGSYANATCLGKSSCTLTSSSQADPCEGIVKRIVAAAHCSSPPGGYSPVSLPSPTCALNGEPCPPPNWPPTWNLTQSTVIQPWCAVNLPNQTAFDPAHPWGLVSLAWDCAATREEAATVPICARLKAEGKAHRCFMYHNQVGGVWGGRRCCRRRHPPLPQELALGWLESQAAVMYDPAHAGWFMRWPNGSAYNEPGGMHGDGDQYFWNFTVRRLFLRRLLWGRRGTQ